MVTQYTFGASDVAAAILRFELHVAIAQYVDNDGSYTEGIFLYHMDIGKENEN